MRYSTIINNLKSKEWGLTIQQAYLFAWFYELPSWANKVMIENEIFYFASKTKAVEELPILTDKTDTMYRYYKQLEELGLIIIKKIDNKDYISLTSIAKDWNFSKSEYSENNPTLLGNLSENNSENNPTYNNIIYNKDISNNNESIDFQKLIAYYNKILNKSCRVIPDKAKKQFNQRIKEGYKKEDIQKVIDNASNDSFHKDNNYKHLTLEFLSRPDKFERYASMQHKKPIDKGGFTNH
ncbi:hypothetical protein [Flavobacterium phage FCOV-F14]|uniref:Uncharacterized protein n=8 Tax=Ficleduovirus FCL2 TaxID=2560473 RepID=A0A0A0YQB4_9CAUD|nr:hypothetical protein ABG42_gp54 [Flavobacterium phage FCL-2]QCW21164.1 hypothetical protein [Flavobacterium phage FCOV-F13]QCW21238.1 hypothetical protein [Flavobacterium phage FCOV-F16]QCW21540.1 hypothetical protein [Flavobacterium phage FCOV-F45]QCW21614.1 hypothetical protein [Flavobacterium phage FCOV-F46]QCW21688.1 hypothetical protein [Flavobacterium phage FCOV-F54]QNJ51710.1 hypothetical protein [Flavobacterium phage FCOV-F14]QNJ51784.1 hypothetical protein [Flavobacterium phage F